MLFDRKKMWSGNGNMQPPGMWSAPGHNPMMESQWASHYQEMPQNQVSTYIRSDIDK